VSTSRRTSWFLPGMSNMYRTASASRPSSRPPKGLAGHDRPLQRERSECIVKQKERDRLRGCSPSRSHGKPRSPSYHPIAGWCWPPSRPVTEMNSFHFTRSPPLPFLSPHSLDDLQLCTVVTHDLSRQKAREWGRGLKFAGGKIERG
jgi:hypothetical protein